MDRKVINIVGNGAHENRGCEAIYRGTMRILAKFLPGSLINNYFTVQNEDFPTKMLSNYKVNEDLVVEAKPLWLPQRRSSLKYTLKGFVPWCLAKIFIKMEKYNFSHLHYAAFNADLMNKIETADIALQLGGDNYTLDYGLPLYVITLDRIMNRKRIPVALWGASIGPFSAVPNFEKWIKRHFDEKVEFILVREPESFEYMKKIGLSKKIFLVGDPAFVMEPTPPSTAVWKHGLPKGYIGVNFSPLLARYRDNDRGLAGWERNVGDLIRRLRQNFPNPLIFIPHVISENSNDYTFMRQAIRCAKLKEDEYIMVPPDLTAAELKWIISGLDLLIAARTHATIAALSSFVPTISIAYSIKAHGLNRQIFSNQNYVIPLRELNAERLIKTSRITLERADCIRNQLSHVIPIIQRSAFSAGAILQEYLK